MLLVWKETRAAGAFPVRIMKHSNEKSFNYTFEHTDSSFSKNKDWLHFLVIVLRPKKLQFDYILFGSFIRLSKHKVKQLTPSKYDVFLVRLLVSGHIFFLSSHDYFYMLPAKLIVRSPSQWPTWKVFPDRSDTDPQRLHMKGFHSRPDSVLDTQRRVCCWEDQFINWVIGREEEGRSSWETEIQDKNEVEQ